MKHSYLPHFGKETCATNLGNERGVPFRTPQSFSRHYQIFRMFFLKKTRDQSARNEWESGRGWKVDDRSYLQSMFSLPYILKPRRV